MHSFLVSWPRPRHQALERGGPELSFSRKHLGAWTPVADVGTGAHETVGSSHGEDSGFNSVAFAHEMFPPSRSILREAAAGGENPSLSPWKLKPQHLQWGGARAPAFSPRWVGGCWEPPAGCPEGDVTVAMSRVS